jgi:hypothetical protein
MTPALLDELRRLDDGSMPVAELRRRLGARCDELGVHRPSYECVRVHAEAFRRRRRIGPSTAEVVLDVALRARPPHALLEHVSGVGVAPLRRGSASRR